MSSIPKEITSQTIYKPNWNPFGFEQWVAWLGATAIGVAGITTFFYVNFETKDSFAQYKQDQERYQDRLEKQLERIETKLDQVLK